jgi:hypothetical protein
MASPLRLSIQPQQKTSLASVGKKSIDVEEFWERNTRLLLPLVALVEQSVPSAAHTSCGGIRQCNPAGNDSVTYAS